MAASAEDVKVVLIDTQYVQTDPLSFKSVVQKLTGKDSCVSWIEESSFSGAKMRETKVAVKGAAADHRRSCCTAAVGGGGYGVSKLSTNLSFRDLDRMILEAPPMDELKWLWSE